MGKRNGVKDLFEGRHFDREVIILCVRWYLRFKLSLRDLVEMMAERGLSMAHTTIMRWVQHFAPEFEKRWRRSRTSRLKTGHSGHLAGGPSRRSSRCGRRESR
jgi:transposase-like protein